MPSSGSVILAWALAVATLAASAGPAAAQFLSTSSIGGTVADDTGSVLPGVSVLLTSPALQVSRLQTVTDATGRYQFPDLQAGLYQIRFELSDFQPLVREGLQLSVGFAAKVDAVLKIGTLGEVVTVTGASPVVDVATTGGRQLFSGEMLNDLIPGSRLNSELGRMTPGLTATSPANIGLLGAAAAGGFATYGETNFRCWLTASTCSPARTPTRSSPTKSTCGRSGTAPTFQRLAR